MNTQRATVSDEQLSGDAVKGDWLKVDVTYDNGTAIMGSPRPRGFYVHVGYEGREVREHCISRSFEIYASGTSAFLEPATRFNAKKLALLAARLKAGDATVDALKARVLEMRTNNLARKEQDRATAEARRLAKTANVSA